MKRFCLLIVAVLFFSFNSSRVGKVYAQDKGALQLEYKQKLSTYRAQYDLVAIALQQYINLKTLAAQEGAVNSLRDFLLIRSDVLTSHFQILQASVDEQTRANPLWVASTSAEIGVVKNLLSEHHTRSDIAIDRIRADAEAAWFQSHEKQFKNAADRTQCVIGIARLSDAIVSIETVKGKIDAWIATAPMSETTKVEKTRGSDELGRTITNAKLSLAQAQTFYEQGSTRNSSTLLYPQIRPVLVSSYTSVLRGVEYAKELTQ